MTTGSFRHIKRSFSLGYLLAAKKRRLMTECITLKRNESRQLKVGYMSSTCFYIGYFSVIALLYVSLAVLLVFQWLFVVDTFSGYLLSCGSLLLLAVSPLTVCTSMSTSMKHPYKSPKDSCNPTMFIKSISLPSLPCDFLQTPSHHHNASCCPFRCQNRYDRKDRQAVAVHNT